MTSPGYIYPVLHRNSATQKHYTGYVANLTIAIDDELLKRARIRALETGTSVNALVREYLQDFAGADSAPTESLLEMALEMAVGGLVGFDRDELHAR